MGKILKTINLVIDAIRPKHVTWTLDKNGIGYEKIEDGLDNNFENYLTEDALENLKTKETEDVFESYLTDSGIPWIQTKKDPDNETEINKQDTENPKFSNEELKFVNKTNVETIQSIQEAIDLKSKIMKKTVTASKDTVQDMVYCSFTPEELAREKQADVEVRRRLKEIIESKFKINQNIKHCSFTPEELAREKQADAEVRRRLKEIIESKFKIDKQVLLRHFFDSKKGEKYYLNRYNKEQKFKDWFDATFPNYTIKKALELAIPCTSSKSNAHETFDQVKDLQNYIDVYNNDPMYKEWFDRKYPGQSIYEIIGMSKTLQT